MLYSECYKHGYFIELQIKLFLTMIGRSSNMVINALKMNCFTGIVINEKELTKSFAINAISGNLLLRIF